LNFAAKNEALGHRSVSVRSEVLPPSGVGLFSYSCNCDLFSSLACSGRKHVKERLGPDELASVNPNPFWSGTSFSSWSYPYPQPCGGSPQV